MPIHELLPGIIINVIKKTNHGKKTQSHPEKGGNKT